MLATAGRRPRSSTSRRSRWSCRAAARGCRSGARRRRHRRCPPRSSTDRSWRRRSSRQAGDVLRDVGPVRAAVARVPHLAVVRAGPDQPAQHRRRRDREHDLAVELSEVVADDAAGRDDAAGILRRQIGADHLPALAAVRRLRRSPGSRSTRSSVERIEGERRRPVAAVLGVGRRRVERDHPRRRSSARCPASRPSASACCRSTRTRRCRGWRVGNVNPDSQPPSAWSQGTAPPPPPPPPPPPRPPAAGPPARAALFATASGDVLGAAHRPVVLHVAVDVSTGPGCRRRRDTSARSAAGCAERSGRDSS